MSAMHSKGAAAHQIGRADADVGICYVGGREASTAEPVVLVVDSDPILLELMHEILWDHGYQPVLCSRGEQAFDLIVRERPDLVILDLWLEHAHAGEMVLGLLQVDPATRHIPVILTTTNPRLREQKPALSKHIGCRIVTKPFSLDALVLMIQETLRSSTGRGKGERIGRPDSARLGLSASLKER